MIDPGKIDACFGIGEKGRGHSYSAAKVEQGGGCGSITRHAT